MRSAEYEDSFVKIAGLIGGEEYLKVARGLVNTDDATDEEIASATGLRINIIRKVLYDMFGKALITGIRVKDEKKGWFVYRWRAKRDQVDSFIDNQKKKILFFKCSNCKGALNIVDNGRVKEALRYKIEQITADISSRKQ